MDRTTQMMLILEHIQQNQIKLTNRMDKLENPNPESSQTRERSRRTNQDKDIDSNNSTSKRSSNMGSKKDTYWQDRENQSRTRQATYRREETRWKTNIGITNKLSPISPEKYRKKGHAIRRTNVACRFFSRGYCDMGDMWRFDQPYDLDDGKKDKTYNPIPRTYGEQSPRRRRQGNTSGRNSDTRDMIERGRRSTQTQNTRREPENRRRRPVLMEIIYIHWTDSVSSGIIFIYTKQHLTETFYNSNRRVIIYECLASC